MPSRFNIAASRQKHLASCRRRRPSAATRLLTNSLSSGGAAANCDCSDKARGLCGLDAEPLFRTAKDPIWQGNGVGQYLPSDDIPKFQQPPPTSPRDSTWLRSSLDDPIAFRSCSWHPSAASVMARSSRERRRPTFDFG